MNASGVYSKKILNTKCGFQKLTKPWKNDLLDLLSILLLMSLTACSYIDRVFAIINFVSNSLNWKLDLDIFWSEGVKNRLT